MTEQETREKAIKGLETCEISGTREDCEGYGCPYFIYNDAVSDECQVTLFREALALLKAQENEIKALRLLVDWAEECDFGLDNIRWREYVTKEELDRVEDYIEKMIYVARRAVEQG